ncbi:Gfo/Idh/MocA family protein [Alkalilimnicola sp. S0819]|uniref:Gfo/Idh/MocA family protein n=1 Tax=Alkalilimnicola sp. S0819 TaxID=2613922 RepID=UPI00126287D6|nr:Gfo/Idh/MocA family oxidoreductase [Alkalilimnicola sp. S0819]KAB7628238.1 Gfo/Idh/MocA family oxidoreductase [Alkalilimnicola sp. S0819]MPQ15129.1 hypothetical protein [Alkalilimnicola sp. S0819]
MKALLIGCGNIGGFYDWNSPDVRTYAKAFHTLGIEFAAYDQDPARVHRLSQRYGAKALSQWDELPVEQYDLVVVSSPTPTHSYYLSSLFAKPPGLIICEKPVDSDPQALDLLAAQYQDSAARVMVNFHRRFQPRVKELAERVEELQGADPCRTVVVTYQRGFHNNAVHAMDLLAVVFGQPFEPSEPVVLNAVADEFPADPTMTVSCQWHGMQVIFVGLVGARFSHFEMTLYCGRHVVVLRDGGDRVEFLSAPDSSAGYYPALSPTEVWSGVLSEHMTHVLAHAQRMLSDESLADNFMESVDLSKAVFSILKRASKR